MRWMICCALVFATLAAGSAAAEDKTAPGAGTAAQLEALERQSWVAWQSHDGKFFEGFLSDDHVEVGPRGTTTKASVVAGVTSPVCHVESYAVGDFHVNEIAADAALVVYHAEQKTTCGGTPVPSPVWATSVYVKRAGRWQNALYEQTPASARP